MADDGAAAPWLGDGQLALLCDRRSRGWAGEIRADGQRARPVRRQNSFSATRVGWTVGAGVEYALTRQWSLKGEYLYVDLGKTGANASTLTPALPAGFGSFNGSTAVALTANIGRVGLNYHF